jgi:membrane protein DedA with SNARE-associated domain
MSAIKKAIGKRLHRSSITEARPEGHGASAANVTSELEEAMPQHLVSTLQAAGSDQSGLTGLAGLITDIIATLGPIGVGALVALETLFPPIPSELILPLSGYLASQGRMSLAMVIIGATVGSLVGALALYWAGAALGQKRLRRLAERMPLVEVGDLERAEGWFDRHGGLAVLIGRVVPVVRSLVSVPAGVEHMPLWRFVLYTIVGSGVYNLVLVGLGYVLGSRWKTVEQYSNYLNYAIYAAIAIGVGLFVVKRLRRRGAHQPTGTA